MVHPKTSTARRNCKRHQRPSALALAAAIAASAVAVVHGPALASEGTEAKTETRLLTPPAEAAPETTTVFGFADADEAAPAPRAARVADAKRPAPRLAVRVNGERLEVIADGNASALRSRHVGAVRAIATTNDGALVAVATDRGLQLYDVATLKHRATIPLERAVAEARFVGRDLTLALRGEDGSRTRLRLAALLDWSSPP